MQRPDHPESEFVGHAEDSVDRCAAAKPLGEDGSGRKAVAQLVRLGADVAGALQARIVQGGEIAIATQGHEPGRIVGDPEECHVAAAGGDEVRHELRGGGAVVDGNR